MFYKDIPFKFCGSVSVLLDLWTPSEEAPAAGWPLVIFFHGGGFCFGDKNNSSAAERWRDMLLAKGVAFASAGYRHGGYGGALQAVASDGADAVRFFGKNGAKYAIDGKRILVSGHSAGGQVAMLVGLAGEKFRDNWSDKETECRVLGVVSLAGTPTMQFGRYWWADCAAFLAKTGRIPQWLRKLSRRAMLNAVKRSGSPFFACSRRRTS